MGSDRGFTLLELLIAVTIVGVLAVIAYPAYTAYLVRGNRAAAQTVLMDIAQSQQQYLLDKRSYANQATLNPVIPENVRRHYDITITLPPGPPAFTVAAAPKPGTRQVGDGTLTIDHTGKKLPADKW